MSKMHKFKWDGKNYYFEPERLLVSRRPIKALKKKPKSPPLKMDLDHLILPVAGECNLACPYCYTDAGRYGGQAKAISEATGFKAIDFFFDHLESPAGIITFFGGEPLLRWNLVKRLIDYASRKAARLSKRISFSLSTNGTLLDKEKADYLRGLEGFLGLISLDSHRAKIEDRLRPFKNGRGSFHVLLRKIKELRLQELFAPRATITRHNLELFALFKFIIGLGFSDFYFVPVQSNDPALALRPQDYRKLVPQVEQIVRFDLSLGSEIGEVIPYGFAKFVSFLTIGQPRVSCSGGRQALTVSADGDIYACHHLINREHFKLGDLKRGLDAKKHGEFLKEVCTASKPKCQQCWAKNLCGGCFEEAYLNNGSTQEPTEAFCRWHKMMFKYAVVLFEAISSTSRTTPAR